MRELTAEEVSIVSGAGCAEIATETLGGSIVAGFGVGVRAGAMGGVKGALLGAGIGAVGGAATYGFCTYLQS